MLEGLRIKEIALQYAKSGYGFRLEAEFFLAKTGQSGMFTGGEIASSFQYGTSEALNEVGEGYPVLRLDEFDSYFIGKPKKFCSYLTHNQFDSLRLLKGDVLVCRTNGNPNLVGRASIVMEDTQIAYASYLFKIRTNPSLILPETLVLFLRGKYGRQEIDKYSMQSNQTNFSPAKFKEIAIPKISFRIQRLLQRIMQEVYINLKKSNSVYDCSIARLLCAIHFLEWTPDEKNIAIKLSSYVKEVSRFDAEYYQPGYDEIAKRLSANPLGCCTAQSLLNDHTITNGGTKTWKYIELANIGNSGEILDCTEGTFIELPSRARLKVNAGDVLVSSIEGSLASCALVPPEYDGALCSTGFHVLRSTEINPETLLVLFKSWPIQALMKRGCTGTILAAISNEYMAYVPVPKISPIVQEEIAAKVQESFALRKESKRLLDSAKRAVEVAIESGEDAAMKYLKDNGIRQL